MKNKLKVITFIFFILVFSLAAQGCSAPPQGAEAAPITIQEASDADADEPAVDDILAALEGLSIDTFFEESFNQLSLRTPEALTHAGVSATLGLRDDQLNNISDAYLKETQQLEAGVLEILLQFDR